MTEPLPPLSAPLETLLAAAASRYAVAFEPVSIGGVTLEILQITDMDAYVERLLAELPPGMPLELPFWAKIWRTAFLMAYFVQRLPADGRSMLEIGAGLGLAGLFAAAHGFDVTLTDIHPEALLFSRINALKNGLGDRVAVAQADFTQDRLGRRFDCIIGSEVLYVEKNFKPLIKFLRAHLAEGPQAEVVLAKEYSRKAKKFFKKAGEHFLFSEMTIGYKEDAAAQATSGEKHLAQIIRMKRRP